MLVMFDVIDPVRVRTMTTGEGRSEVIDLKGLPAPDEDFVRSAVAALVQAAPEAETTEAIGSAKEERTDTRLAYRSGYYSRSLITWVGTLELRVPRDRMGRFSTELFEHCQRSEKELVGTLPQMYVPGGLDPEGEGGDQGVVRAQFLGVVESLCTYLITADAV